VEARINGRADASDAQSPWGLAAGDTAVEVSGQNAQLLLVRFEVFTAVTMKNGAFSDVTPCGSCKNRRFGGT
jgi:hypothetical protein